MRHAHVTDSSTNKQLAANEQLVNIMYVRDTLTIISAAGELTGQPALACLP
jgi:hypothetical protein